MGHYDTNPFNDKPKKQIIYMVKPSISLSQGIINIINSLKNDCNYSIIRRIIYFKKIF